MSPAKPTAARLPSPRRVHEGRARFQRNAPGIEYGVLNRIVGAAIRRAQIGIYEDFDRHFAPLGITPPRYSALMLISYNQGLTQARLAELVGVGGTAIVALVHVLEKKGWVRRTISASDRRANVLELTAKGRALAARLEKMGTELDALWTSQLTAAEKATLLSLLNKVGLPAE